MKYVLKFKRETQRPRRRVVARALGIVLGAGLVVLGGMVPRAEATHFRFGHNPWTRGVGNAVTFNFVQAWRLAADDDLTIDFGDGSTDALGPQVVIGTFSDLAGEEYLIESHATPHSYAGEGPFLASAESCCRISSLINAGDDDERIETVVDLRNGNLGSPVSSVPVIVQFPQGVVYNYALPVADPDGDPVTCRLATFSESMISSIATAGGFPVTVSSDCMLGWNTAGTVVGQKYAVQVMLEETHQGNVGKVALDFIIEITDNLGNPPTCSGVSGNHIVNVGQTFMADVTGSDADGGNLQIGHLGLPPGATLTPPTGTIQAEPFEATFAWTPQQSDAGTAHAVTLVYSDPGGLQGTCAFSLNVPQSVCGNTQIEPPFEQCDDGNTVPGDGCDGNCQLEGECGDGIVQPGEQCDDENVVDGDGCSATCQLEGVCGNEVVEAGEQCDGGDCCTIGCTFATPGTACGDDGNACSDDVCDALGQCAHQPDDTNPCTDDDACTTSDSCQSGSCVGSDPVVCEASDQCHAPGSCDPGTGSCSAGAAIGCTIDTAMDSFLRVSSPNTNEGANPVLALSGAGPGRPIVSFDLGGIDLTGLTSARLVLSVASNRRGWGSQGRAVEAYPVLAGFTEGNGQQVGVPPSQSTRGSVPGVTFKCASDGNLSNPKPDCHPQWAGGPIGPLSDSIMHGNQTAGAVEFDVTADVLAGHSSWLVRKANEILSGLVEYHSREGAAAAGDPDLGPRLELDY